MFSTRIRPSDVDVITQSMKRHGLDKSKLLRMCLDYAAFYKPKPRSMEHIKGKDLKEIGIGCNETQMELWRRAAKLAGLPFHFWVRECAVPVAAMDEIAATNPEREMTPVEKMDSEIADPVNPNYPMWRASHPVTINVRALHIHRYRFQIAARSQLLSLNKWIISVLAQAAEYHIKNPKNNE